MNIILASGSPRRKELLEIITKDFEVFVSNIEEKLEVGESVEEQVENLAYNKAKDVFDKTQSNRIVIGADTIVVKDGIIFGKPLTKENAVEMLKELTSGDRVHEVITGLTIIIEKDGKIEEHKTHEKTYVHLYDMKEQEIEEWVDSGMAMDKAGAYGIQCDFRKYIEKIDGNYDTVVGLPVSSVYQIIKDIIK